LDWILNTQGWLVVASAALLLTSAANALPNSESATPNVEKGEHQTEGSEHTIIVGVGGVADLELSNGSLHLGPNAFVEYEAVENWLELELSASLLAVNGGREVPIDLLFKKPFRLTRQLDPWQCLSQLDHDGRSHIRMVTPTTYATWVRVPLWPC
jgi:hypothetical protein